MLEVENLSVRYRGNEALEKVSFAIATGQLVGVIGPNGAGKSTMLKAMLGLVANSTGWVKFCGKPLKQQRGKVAYIPQRSHIDWDYPTTVWNVVMMGRTLKTGLFRGYSRQSKELVEAALERVGIWNLRDRQIGQLSGGQQQRVFLARALAQEADILFFDEPFTGVDIKTEEIIFEIFSKLKLENKTLLVISHDLGDTLRHYDQLILLNKYLVALGSREEVITPGNIQKAYGHNFGLAIS
ncbi:metal ABC transporter ATP-binding protein [Brunnivagina elsteri]|uniref:Manganese ABC transporter ATP-binding protein n=1 Tax=Brunnivagina elsteri CCALA 953 TaxID=987040 RepID=A0A2A2TDK3_9CYAN|nr:metal ABC transporter ATP-binding protein [Calothrix elsteri]PAX51728.1 manganese ABC transporter ATP-binding protein [Calothrix elsteri CCALA 953]